jgi:competence protein ComEC
MQWLIPLPFLIPIGILAGDKINLPVECLLLIIIILILSTCILVLVQFNKTGIILIWIVAFLSSAICVKFRLERTEGNFTDGSQITSLIKIDSFPEYRKDSVLITGEILRLFNPEIIIPAKTRILINIEGRAELTFGQCIISRINCREIEDYGVPGVPSFKVKTSSSGIKYVCRTGTQLTVANIADCDYFFVPFFKKSARFVRKYIENNFSAGLSGFLIAITIGDRSEIDDRVVENFRNSGTAHLLAISGLHVGIAGFFVYFLIKTILKLNYKFLIYFNLKRITSILTIPFLSLFALIAGFSPSTQRALVMSVIILITIALMRKPHILFITFFTWCFLLLINPSSLFDISFQLSFSAVFAIILFYSKFKKNFLESPSVLSKIINFISGNILTTIAGFAGTAIIIAKTFRELPIFFIPANLIAVPVTTIILPATIINFLLFWLPVNLNPLNLVISFLTEFLLTSVNFFGTFKFSTLKVIPPDNLQFVIYYLILLCLIVNFRPKTRAILLPVLFILFLLNNFNLRTEKTLRITFIDVGQGDSTLIEFPDGKSMLVDCGKEYNDFNAGERIIAPFLWHKKIKKIDTLVITHQQADHAGGCNYILDRFNVEEIWIPDTDWVLEDFNIENINVRKFKNAAIMDNNGIRIISMNNGVSRNPEDNNNSMVLKIEYKNFSALLTGDIENEVERVLINKNIKSTVIKIPHHGSCTSSSYEFLNSVSPEIAVISAGRHNSFHHPCRQTIDRIKSITDKILITAYHGSITITTDGEKYCYSAYFSKNPGSQQYRKCLIDKNTPS